MRDATKEEMKSVRDYIDSISQTVLSIPISENTTNRDMMKAIFPQIETRPSFIDSVTKVYNLGTDNCEDFYLFDTDWLNAPYKVDKENE